MLGVFFTSSNFKRLSAEQLNTCMMKQLNKVDIRKNSQGHRRETKKINLEATQLLRDLRDSCSPAQTPSIITHAGMKWGLSSPQPAWRESTLLLIHHESISSAHLNRNQRGKIWHGTGQRVIPLHLNILINPHANETRLTTIMKPLMIFIKSHDFFKQLSILITV